MKLKSTEAVDTWNFREEVKKDWVLKLEKELEVNWEHATQGICLFPGDNKLACSFLQEETNKVRNLNESVILIF